jgi:predicted KAP-like P-loop ATPase
MVDHSIYFNRRLKAMRLFPPLLEIGDEEGFTKEKDIFERRSAGKGLTNVVCRVSDPLVIAIDSEWGTGKTTFLKMWAGELRKQQIPVVFFDAFQHDYAEDAFTAIAGELISLASDKKKQNDPAAKKFIKSSTGAAKILLRSGLKIGVKLATAGALDAADIGNAASEIAKEVSDLEDKYIGELLTKQKQENLAIQSFRDALESLPSLLSPPRKEADTSNPKPLVIIIDELDRCRPTFALQVLERIKHFFSVPGVHFVLGTHLGQIRNSVSAVYGSGIDSTKYLQKFISFTLHLTESIRHNLIDEQQLST